MTVLNSGATREYSDNFARAFGAKSAGLKRVTAKAANTRTTKANKVAKAGSAKKSKTASPAGTRTASRKSPSGKKSARKA